MHFRSLQVLKHMYLSPLQLSWQIGVVKGVCPDMAPVIDSYMRHYSDILDAVRVSLDDREEAGIGENESLTYGETHWTSFIKILKAIDIKADDHFVDLGCGTGFLCFLVHMVYQIPVLGIDLVPRFIQNAQAMSQELDLPDAQFIQQDFFKVPLQKPSIYYITCTCFPTPIMKELTQVLLRNTLTGDRIITVTRKIKDHRFKQLKHFKVKFSWGNDLVYICKRL